MPSGELEGTTLKLTTGREVTDGHSHFPTMTTRKTINMKTPEGESKQAVLGNGVDGMISM